MKTPYIHTDIPELSTDFLKDSDVLVKSHESSTPSQVMAIAVLTRRLARHMGIRSPETAREDLLPYDEDNDNLVFAAPLLSALVGRDIHFLRGWKQFNGCIKGTNALGLMAEQVQRVLRILTTAPVETLNRHRRDFLSSRTAGGRPVFSTAEVEKLSVLDLSEVDVFDLAVWKAFARRTIVCSTSSNMGISLHDALRAFQRKMLSVAGRTFPLLNADEGSLIIWCPDDQADFMNPEKTAFLKGLEAEKPPLTRLKTYINRQQRDPGALRDALLCGGYFFPTNPQSKEELQNLLFVALTMVARERRQSIPDLLKDANVQATLAGLGAEIAYGKVLVTEGIEGGIAGLMVPYLVMLEERLPLDHKRPLSTWNQASIGAALAAEVLADTIVRRPECLSEQTRSDFYAMFPNISLYLDDHRLGRDPRTNIHGVFDLANLQSLAQLLGVVVERHLSGRGTAFVGLGSSSYSNGNRCYEILKTSFENDGPFKGRAAFHPATHTLNPFAQALIYGEEVHRCLTHPAYRGLAEDARLRFVRDHARKPEPAGAAALAGYLLARLDTETLSLVEIAQALSLMGFTKNSFLVFCGLPASEPGANGFLQECYEEGPFMGDLARNILLFLDWPLRDLAAKAAQERIHSRLNYRLRPLDGASLEAENPRVNICLTGDNTRQPDPAFVEDLVKSQTRRSDERNAFLEGSKAADAAQGAVLSWAGRIFAMLGLGARAADRAVQTVTEKTFQRLIDREIKSRLKRNGS